MVVKKSSLFSFVLALVLLLTFGTFQAYPGGMLVKNVWIIFSFLGFLFFYPLWLIKNKLSVTGFELYSLSLILLIPCLSSFAAWLEFGQPLLYGVMAERSAILIMTAVALLQAYKFRIITIANIQTALVLLAWSTLILYFIMSVFIDPSSVAHYGEGFVGGGNVGDFELKFRSEFIVFGYFFYVFLAVRSRRYRYWLLSLPFLFFLVFVAGGRSLILSVLCATFILIFRWSSYKRLMLLMPRLFAAIALIVIALLSFASTQMVDLADTFNSAFEVVLTGEEGSDASSNARISELLVAVPYILKNWHIGSGDISNQWGGGYEGVLDAYFYPTDIGIFGILYVYGFVGLGLFLIQFLFAIEFSSKIAKLQLSSPLTDACKGFLLYFALHSIVTGRFAFYSQLSLVFIAILACVFRRAQECVAQSYTQYPVKYK